MKRRNPFFVFAVEQIPFEWAEIPGYIRCPNQFSLSKIILSF